MKIKFKGKTKFKFRLYKITLTDEDILKNHLYNIIYRILNIIVK